MLYLPRVMRSRGGAMSVCGFLNLNKPTGVSSRWVVDQVVPLVHPAKVGHAGTLDPLAEGVLVVGIGAATRLIGEVQSQAKTYRGTFQLGCTSPSEDIETQVSPLANPPHPTRERLEAAAGRLTGAIQQTPPAYSAVKVGGRRAYRLARRGQTPDLSPREIVVHELRVERYEYPELVLHIRCGAGTYVRTLGRDLARSVGSDAVMSALIRTAVGPFRIEEAIRVEDLNPESLHSALMPPLAALSDWPRRQVGAAAADDLRNGRPAALDATEQRVAVVDEWGGLVALAARREGGAYWPTMTMPKKP